MVDLPAIDMRAEEHVIVAQLLQMMTTVGFLHVINVDGFEEDTHLEACKAFHSMPLE